MSGLTLPTVAAPDATHRDGPARTSEQLVEHLERALGRRHRKRRAHLPAELRSAPACPDKLADYHGLVSIHRPVGILILILVVIRYVNRRFSTMPPFPVTMSSPERRIAHASEMLMYTLLFVQPLVGWGMLS